MFNVYDKHHIINYDIIVIYSKMSTGRAIKLTNNKALVRRFRYVYNLIGGQTIQPMVITT